MWRINGSDRVSSKGRRCPFKGGANEVTVLIQKPYDQIKRGRWSDGESCFEIGQVVTISALYRMRCSMLGHVDALVARCCRRYAATC